MRAKVRALLEANWHEPIHRRSLARNRNCRLEQYVRKNLTEEQGAEILQRLAPNWREHLQDFDIVCGIVRAAYRVRI